MGVLIFVEVRAIPTAWYCVEIRKPDPYASLSASRPGKHERRAWGGGVASAARQ